MLNLSSNRTTTVYSSYNTGVASPSGVPYRPYVQLTKKPTNAPLTSTPKPTPTPTYFFKRINMKMSYEEVVKAIGRKEDRKQVKPDFTTYIWKQRASDGDTVNVGSTLEVTFNEGSISEILQH